MPTITGPYIQMPPAQSPMMDKDGNLGLDWASFLHSLQQTAFGLSRSGPTTSRPTSTLDGRWIGMPYFDTTLGFEIYLKSVNPDVWVRYDGVSV